MALGEGPAMTELIGRIRQDLAAGRFQEVVDLMQQTGMAAAADPEVFRLAARACRRLRYSAQAAAHMHAAVMLDPGNAEYWLDFAAISYEMRQLALAEYAWSRAESLGGALPPIAAREAARLARGEQPLDRDAITEAVMRLEPHPWLQAALTIDDAPSPDVTPVILDVLRARSVRATFFVVGEWAEDYPHLLTRTVEEGHMLYSHGWTHALFSELGGAAIADELERTEAVLRRFRPTPDPYPIRLPGGIGWPDARVHAAIRSWNDRAVLMHWNVDTHDCDAPAAFLDEQDVRLEARLRVFETILDPLFSAPILLTHDNLAENRRKPVAFFRSFFSTLIDEIHGLGMSFALPDLTHIA
jgi:peptidoglycan/xylan/chitin deacetylase (PgdA/CDA1 family)